MSGDSGSFRMRRALHYMARLGAAADRVQRSATVFKSIRVHFK